MPDLTINITQNAQKTLQKLAETSGKTIPVIVEKALENYRRYLFLMQANQAFADLKKKRNSMARRTRRKTTLGCHLS
ncbi:hypothetical protein PCC7424_3407 [Gloeothece citriformis PCC 7424]|uniref:Uncharacterized protein n=1 Tax=Gloeothece citriformis (strain PCC 7424) TaxID=65393 RepID=B7KF86_GLOC7|nr:hypothetical protein [Gloeothece citriformis]ACK71802.1 hypothetical protein PCC7424_3407 [Gloeothece citriformis PCC 7424]